MFRRFCSKIFSNDVFQRFCSLMRLQKRAACIWVLMVCSWTVWWHHLEHYLLLRRLHGSASRHAPLREIEHRRPNQGNLSSVACEWTYPSYASFVAASYGPCMCNKISFNDMFKTLFSDLFEYVVQSLLAKKWEPSNSILAAAILIATRRQILN